VNFDVLLSGLYLNLETTTPSGRRKKRERVRVIPRAQQKGNRVMLAVKGQTKTEKPHHKPQVKWLSGRKGWTDPYWCK